MAYVAVPAEALYSFLESKKFEKTTQRQEIVYIRRSVRNPDVQLKVYTSISVGGGSARGCGKDSIKVCVVFDNGTRSFGIGKFAPVFRVTSTESVLERLTIRLGQAARRANEWLDQNGCAKPQSEWQQRLDDKEALQAAERAQEIVGFKSDPDYQMDPCSEPDFSHWDES